MTAFFVITDQAVTGPFTGIELREAAMAAIITPDAIIGGAPEGPWFHASDIGLFSEKKAPLPHPPETTVPHYQVRGMPGAFQGPFKLRELIGFAARGMLPPEAQLQSDVSEHWIAVHRIRMLESCLNGDLVLIDRAGKVVLRSHAVIERANEQSPTQDACAPMDLAKSVDLRDKTAIASENAGKEAPERWTYPNAIEDDAEPVTPSRLSLACARLADRVRASMPRLSIRPRLAIQLACMILIFAGVASAFSLWKQIGLQPDQVLGDWIAVSDDSESPRFGISLRADGRCVLFNAEGDSWSGDFVWSDRIDDQTGFAQIAPFSTVFDVISPHHQRGVIEPTDGYIRLDGFVKEPPQIDGHKVRDLFLRRDGDALHVGYVAAVHWSKDSKQMEAGWLIAQPSQVSRPDVVAKLRVMELELPVPMAEFGGERPRHLSDAIDAALRGLPNPDGEGLVYETLAYSATVDSAYLLKHFGLPDEARSVFPFESWELPRGPSFEDAQLVRYGDWKFILSSTGQLRFVELMSSAEAVNQ